VKPKGIDDVPVLALTLYSKTGALAEAELTKVAHAVEAELKRIAGTRDIYTITGVEDRVTVTLDAQRMAAYQIDPNDLRQALQTANVSQEAGSLLKENTTIDVTAGSFLTRIDEVASLIVGVHEGGPVYLSDVAEVERKMTQPEQYIWVGAGPAAQDKNVDVQGEYPAVTIAVAKKPGVNAVNLTQEVIQRFNELKGIVVPDDVGMIVTRDYGQTANEKANTLILKLVFATASVVILVLLTLGLREAVIVGAAVVVTLTITLFASWAWGFTINRVSLFALIFSIGILVDDAIVVVENIHRHYSSGNKNLKEVIPLAVDEVGGPTILATFTVIAALLPMAFVSGLMGPYMSPIPINASMGMLISLAVAFILTPWMALRFLKKHEHQAETPDQEIKPAFAAAIFNPLMKPFLFGNKARLKRWLLLVGIILLILISISLAVSKLVVLKMLPFDNKSEFQVVIDMPEGASLEFTALTAGALAEYIATIPEVTDYQVYVGTASPINFNGLVRQYYLRQDANMADIQVNLQGKSERDRKSHEIASSIRQPLQAIAKEYGANVKIVEVPPGPPVIAPLVAEVYGLDYEGQIKAARQLRTIFESTADVVDVDDSVEEPAVRYLLKIDRMRAGNLGLNQQQVVDAIRTVVQGEDISFLRDVSLKYAVPIHLEFSAADKRDLQGFLDLKLRGHDGALIRIGEVVDVSAVQREHAIYHKDLMPVVFVTGDVAGEVDSPLYGLFDISGQLNDMKEFILDQYFLDQPDLAYQYSLKWDGEWQITYDTFRDMGAAYMVGMVLIYLLVVAQFRSYLAPLIIMAPIPLTIIGVLPGHAILGAPFTATSMIGMIALAGIIVRNSILLVDFINQELARGQEFKTAVINASAVRAKPILLTGIAAMLGALFILDDPIFNGLAISLIFGILVSTLLTLIVIPLMYYAFMHKKMERAITVH
jgi:multidrug efflux pump subunit AcrB